MPEPVHPAECRPAGIWRRSAAMLYDSLLMLGLLFVTTVPVVVMNGGAISTDAGALRHALFTLYLWLVAGSFYPWFWTHGGQTLGMSAWRIRVVDKNGGNLGWRAAYLRSLTACLGLANLACALSNDKRGWHEKLSHSYTIVQPKIGK